MKILHSKEDYLECILLLGKNGGQVRAIDIAEHFGYSKASISRAVFLLVEDGMIVLDEDKHIHLTEQGFATASAVYEKHQFFEEMLLTAGVEEQTAAEDACKIEHAISDEAFEKVKEAYSKNHGGQGQ